MKCDICDIEMTHPHLTDYLGNNAQPILDGRCCDACDCLIVIPARMGLSGAEAVGIGKALLEHRRNPPVFGGEEE